MPDPTRLHVVVIDDHTILVDLMALALHDEPDIVFVGQATTAEAGLALVARTQPDVVLMDVRLPDMDGLRATALLLAESPGIRVVILTAASDPALIATAAAVGAAGFTHKSGELGGVLTAIRTARTGAMVVDAALLGGILDPPRTRRRSSGTPRLTPREGEVMELLGLGLDVSRIARRLKITVHTCRGHVKSLLAKFGCHTQLEVVLAATRLGMIDSPHDLVDGIPARVAVRAGPLAQARPRR